MFFMDIFTLSTHTSTTNHYGQKYFIKSNGVNQNICLFAMKYTHYDMFEISVESKSHGLFIYLHIVALYHLIYFKNSQIC